MAGSGAGAGWAIKITGDRAQARGRSLQATQDFAPGDLVAEFTSPLVALPDVAHQETTCSYCLSQAPIPLPDVPSNFKLRACTACRAVRYCSTQCQKSDWAFVHAKECKVLQQVRKGTGQDWLPTPVRALMQVLLRAHEPDIQAAFFTHTKTEGLQGNVADFRLVDGGEMWKGMELQALAAGAYAGLGQGRDKVEQACDILCRVSQPGSQPVAEASLNGVDCPDGDKTLMQSQHRYTQTPLIARTWTVTKPASSSRQPWP
jgi:hypothetical protein